MSKPAASSASERRFPVRFLVFLGGVALLLGLGLALDLRAHGLVWRFFWSQTGEESPAGQIRGMIELMGNLIRPPLNTEPLTPIQHTDDIPYSVNTFLQKEVEEPKLRAMLQMIHEAGFVWLRQEFPWEDIEIHARGDFGDRRTDRNGDGVLDAKDEVDAWAKYDQMVGLTEEYGLKMMVRLSNPPNWAQTNKHETIADNYAPPDDIQDFVNYAVAVATRYKGRISYYQIWNEPNLYPEWGENFVEPARYVDMLCRTHDALKAIDPNIVIITAALGPTISLDGKQGYQDVVFLQNMYDLGAARCFDVLAAQGYGLYSGPTDQRQRVTTVGYTRHIFYRDIMVSNGDGYKPIWISEAAWNAILDADLPPDQISQYGNFGLSTQDEAARYMPLAYQRANEEWPWIGQISYWFFTRPDPFEQGQALYYFRMVEPDYSPEKPTFTPLPVYNTVKDYLARVYANPVLSLGTHQAEHWAITREEGSTLQADESAEFGKAVFTSLLRLTMAGTGGSVRLKSTVPITLSYDGALTTFEPSEDWQSIPFPQTFQVGVHPVAIYADAPFLIDSVTITNTMSRSLLPIILVGVVIAVMTVGVLLAALWQRLR
jgi:polysaccharide biosynthesis protein PslG